MTKDSMPYLYYLLSLYIINPWVPVTAHNHNLFKWTLFLCVYNNEKVNVMAGFDKSLDKELFAESVDFERSRITVAVFSYNEGIAKLQISRENKNASGETSFAKLGRLTKEELEKILPLIEKAKAHL